MRRGSTVIPDLRLGGKVFRDRVPQLNGVLKTSYRCTNLANTVLEQLLD